jgi:hypothetical protein
MLRFAIINNDIVTNIVISASALEPTWIDITETVPAPGIGWSYNGSVFTAPPINSVTYVSLTLKAFWKRFTVSEREALQGILATGTQPQKNKLNAFRDYLQTGGNVELIDDYIIASVNAMETAGVIGSGRANEILTTPISAAEQ